jgi:hypothetical protein
VGVALLFIDGVGIGRKDPSVNPLATGQYLLSRFEDGTGEPLPAGGSWTAVDTCFGVQGRPQSATNQTAILTGEPAPVLLGRHLLGFPNGPLRALLQEKSIVKRLVEAGRSATFANSYPAAYLDALGLPRRPSEGPDLTLPPRVVRKLRPSATTVAMTAGAVSLRTFDDARRGEGLTHDIVGAGARARGLALPERSPEEAAGIFWSIGRGVDFTLFEHHLADEAGHAQDWEAATAALSTFDRFARAVVANSPEGSHVLVCSDHGNVEDLSTRSHTTRPVAVLYFGGAAWVPGELRSVADVGRVVLRLLGV